MKLRELKEKDAPYMLEWMQDERVSSCFYKDFSNSTLEMCINFINIKSENSLNLAIVNDNDEYMGTVSLKNIRVGKDAEFAIVTRYIAHGKGFASYGMKEIMEIGFDKYKLDFIYWNVYKTNIRAIKFYDKHGYERIDIKDLDNVQEYYPNKDLFLWYKSSKD